MNLPHHVNLDLVTVKPVAQAAMHKLLRRQGRLQARVPRLAEAGDVPRSGWVQSAPCSSAVR